MANNLYTTSPITALDRRDVDLRMVHALAVHAQANPEIDPHEGLCALVSHLQGDPLDEGQSRLLSALRTTLLEKYDSFPASL